MIEVTETGDEITVVDHWLDVVVPPPTQPYQLLDLDEPGDALAAGDITVARAAC